MFERRSEPVIPREHFILRLLAGTQIVLLIVGISLILGTLGYRMTEGMPWMDAFFNASMIMSGMGPAAELTTWEGKLFASVYAIYSGLFLIAATGILLTPVFHRTLHKFHAEK